MNQSLSLQLRQFNIYRKKMLRYDIVSALVVFLVAIPLCLGIALASGAPLFSGLLSGMIGGIVVGIISNSAVSVSGPAAGMAAVVLAAITQLGSFQIFLLALTLAGVLQIITGVLRAGILADYIPSNVIQGLLSAIGILLIIKQLPLAFTFSSDLSEIQAHLMDMTTGLTLKPLYDLSYHLNGGAIIISAVSFAILIYFDKTRLAWLKTIPAPIVVVIAGVVINESFDVFNIRFTQDYPHLVNIPNNGFADFTQQLQYPDWSAWKNPQVYVYAMVIAIVASLESLLNVKASEKLDTKHRYCSKDRELLAQGAGNLLAGLIGAIPVTSVIVRTTVNIQAGSKTKFSGILHGFFLLLAVASIPGWLNKIPLASLAVILIYTGYKLANPLIFRNVYAQGLDRFIPFIATVIVIVLTDLLTGIVVGLAISLFYILKSNSQARLDIVQEIFPKGIINRLILPQQVTFLNKASLTAELNTISNHSNLIIDARYCNYIDKEIIEFLNEFKNERAPLKQISLNLVGFKKQYDIHDHIDFISATTYEVQANLSPTEVLNLLIEGNQRFLSDTRIHRTAQVDIQHTAKTQHPIAVVLGCIDSRVPVETIFDMSFGDLFCIRVAGNVVNEDVIASMEFACHVAGAKLIVVLGHTRCGAIHSACDHVEAGHITQLLDKIQPAIQAETATKKNRSSKNAKFIANVTDLNVANTMNLVYQQSEILQTMLDDHKIAIVGAVYDVETGKAAFNDFATQLHQINPEYGSKLSHEMHEVLEKAQRLQK